MPSLYFFGGGGSVAGVYLKYAWHASLELAQVYSYSAKLYYLRICRRFSGDNRLFVARITSCCFCDFVVVAGFGGTASKVLAFGLQRTDF